MAVAEAVVVGGDNESSDDDWEVIKERIQISILRKARLVPMRPTPDILLGLVMLGHSPAGSPPSSHVRRRM